MSIQWKAPNPLYEILHYQSNIDCFEGPYAVDGYINQYYNLQYKCLLGLAFVVGSPDQALSSD